MITIFRFDLGVYVFRRSSDARGRSYAPLAERGTDLSARYLCTAFMHTVGLGEILTTYLKVTTTIVVLIVTIE